MCGWQPIATAPKDRVILCTDGESARWLDSWFDFAGADNWTFKLNRAVKATMWADIPALPAPAADKVGAA